MNTLTKLIQESTQKELLEDWLIKTNKSEI